MTDDPFELRSRGQHRVRIVTASVAAATVVGTGAAVLAIATADSASAGDTGSSSVVQPGTDDEDSGTQRPLSGPAQLPASGSGRTGHASSGGS